MSLINDALKKAQKQRTEGNTPDADLITPSTGPSNEPLQRVVRREKPAGFRTQLFLIGGGAAAVILVGVGAVFFFRSSDKPDAAPKPAPVATTAAPAQTPSTVAAPAATAPVTATITPPISSPAPVVASTSVQPASLSLPAANSVPTPAHAAPATVPTSAASAPAAPASQFVISTLPPAASTPATAVIAAPTTPSASERPKPSARMISVIEHYRVGGIRVSGAESKVLMNDKVYRLNDIVDFELGLKLTTIEPKALTFEDGRGAVHTRNF